MRGNEQHTEAESTQRRVLIASSDPTVYKTIAALIDPGPRARFVCLSADSLKETLRVVASKPLDAIILDLSLDNANGLESMRAVMAQANAPIIILTQAGKESLSLQCLEEGAQEYLHKEDLDTTNLRRALGYAMSRHRANSLRSRLEHADKLASLGQLTAGVAHEISNPTAYVLSNLRQIQEVVERVRAGSGGSGDLELIADMANDSCEGVELIASISQELKHFARSDDHAIEAVNIEELITNSSRMTLNEIRYRAQFEQKVSEVPDIAGNRSQLSQVLINLLINAAHAIETGTSAENKITISADLEDGQVAIRVIDTGKGIHRAAVKKIFEPYYTTKAHGTGLGLPLCRDIISYHEGTMRVFSEEGVGTTFTVRLPVASSLKILPERMRVATPIPPDSRRRKILLIDDEPLLLKSLARMLQSHHDVVSAIGGGEALALLAEDNDYDTIICDLMMPEVDGIHVYEALKQDHPRLVDKLIYLSGGVFTERMSSFLEGLTPQLLDKPVSRDALLEAIGNIH